MCHFNIVVFTVYSFQKGLGEELSLANHLLINLRILCWHNLGTTHTPGIIGKFCGTIVNFESQS